MPWLALLAAPIGLVAVPAAAQPTMQSAQMPARHFDIEVSADGTYNSNIIQNRPITPQSHLVQKDDYVFTPGAKLDFSLPVASTTVFLTAVGDYGFHKYNKILDRETVNVNGGLSRRIGQCMATVSGQYDRRQTDLTDLTFDVVKNVQSTTGGSVQGLCVTGGGLSLSAQADESRLTNSSNLVSDYHSSDVSGGLGYANPGLGSTSFTVSATRLRYDRLASNLLFVTKGYDMTSYGLRYERPIGARLDGRAELGYYKLDQLDSTRANQTGWTGHVGFTYRATPRISAVISYDRAIKPSQLPGSNFTRDNAGELDLHYAMTRRLRVSLGGSAMDRKYDDSALLLQSQRLNRPTEERRRSVYGSIDMKIGVKTSLSLHARHDVRRTDIPAFNYDADIVGLLATVAF